MMTYCLYGLCTFPNMESDAILNEKSQATELGFNGLVVTLTGSQVSQFLLRAQLKSILALNSGRAVMGHEE